MRILAVGAPYFLLLIVAGFAFGLIRELALAPQNSWSASDHRGMVYLAQALIMFLVTLVVTPRIVSRTSLPPSPSSLRRVAFVSLVCVVTAEFFAVLWFRSLTIGGYLGSRDGVAEATYVLLLGLVAMGHLLGKATVGADWRMIFQRGGIAGRLSGSLAVGLVLTVLYHAAGFALFHLLDLRDQSVLTQVMFAPGIVFAGPGFEAQMAAPLLNVVVFSAVFSYLSWIHLTHRARRKLEHGLEPANQSIRNCGRTQG